MTAPYKYLLRSDKKTVLQAFINKTVAIDRGRDLNKKNGKFYSVDSWDYRDPSGLTTGTPIKLLLDIIG